MNSPRSAVTSIFYTISFTATERTMQVSRSRTHSKITCQSICGCKPMHPRGPWQPRYGCPATQHSHCQNKPIRVRAATEDSGEVKALPSADSRFGAYSQVLVTGATGKTGASVVQQLSDMGVNVKALSRDGVKASGMLPGIQQGVSIQEGDLFNYEQVSRAVEGCDAVIICSGPTSRMDPLSPFKVDFQGVENIVAAAKQGNVKKIVMVSSIGADDPLFPLNLFGLVLVMKKFGELAVQRSGIDYTIIRPGGLLNKDEGEKKNPVVAPADTFGLPPRRRPGSILRSKVAEGCIAALVEPEATNKTLEVISIKDAPSRPWKELFETIP